MTYSFLCSGCGLKREDEIRDKYPNEDAAGYVREVVMGRVTVLHRVLSPLCPSKECDLDLPLEPDGAGGWRLKAQ